VRPHRDNYHQFRALCKSPSLTNVVLGHTNWNDELSPMSISANTPHPSHHHINTPSEDPRPPTVTRGPSRSATKHAVGTLRACMTSMNCVLDDRTISLHRVMAAAGHALARTLLADRCIMTNRWLNRRKSSDRRVFLPRSGLD